jgi:hypothetical protein
MAASEIEAHAAHCRERAAPLVLVMVNSLSLREPEFAKNATGESKGSDSMH